MVEAWETREGSMSETGLINKITVALEYAGETERGIRERGKESLLELMGIRNVPETAYSDVYTLADAFGTFADNVRAAERKGKPIAPAAGESDLPEK